MSRGKLVDVQHITRPCRWHNEFTNQLALNNPSADWVSWPSAKLNAILPYFLLGRRKAVLRCKRAGISLINRLMIKASERQVVLSFSDAARKYSNWICTLPSVVVCPFKAMCCSQVTVAYTEGQACNRHLSTAAACLSSQPASCAIFTLTMLIFPVAWPNYLHRVPTRPQSDWIPRWHFATNKLPDQPISSRIAQRYNHTL